MQELDEIKKTRELTEAEKAERTGLTAKLYPQDKVLLEISERIKAKKLAGESTESESAEYARRCDERYPTGSDIG